MVSEVRREQGKNLVIVVDDDPLTRETLVHLCRSVGLEVWDYADIAAMEADVAPGATGALVLDMRLPGLSGVSAVRRIRQGYPHLAIIGLSGHADARTVVRALREGAVDFFDKPFAAQELLEAVQSAADHQLPTVWQGSATRNYEEYRKLFNMLTRQQKVVLRRFGAGVKEDAIAQELELHPRSVQRHLRKALDTLDLTEHDRTLIRNLTSDR